MAREKLFNIIRPECLVLVEAHNLSDNTLRSAIGSSDGKIYEKLLDWAQNHNSVNKMGKVAFEKVKKLQQVVPPPEPKL